MRTFIEYYLLDPTKAIADASNSVQTASWCDNIDDDMIYAEIASPEFRLYEAIILSQASGEQAGRVAVYQ